MQHYLNQLIADRGHKPKILVVDDQPIYIRVMYDLFKDQFDVIMAKNGEQALAQCELHRPDLILLDVMMPGMDGYEVCQRLNANHITSFIPVIFITAKHDEADEVRGFAMGAVDFITKPMNTLLVQARVHMHLALKLHTDLLKSMALVDGLTGVANRRRFDEQLKQDWLQCARSQQKMSVLMIDIDHFKCYNDQYGHQQGDECLRQVASAIKHICTRPYDLVARYGGEEFACLLPNTEHAGAKLLAQRILDHIRGLKIEHTNSPTDHIVTVSIGVASRLSIHDAPAAELVLAADQQLYDAKRLGRSQVSATELA